MTESPLPVDPASPPPGKLCDASGMARIHRYYRAGFGEAPGLVRGVRAGDAAHAELVATELQSLSTSLHAHHEGEDERLWSALEQRAPSCALHVGRMRGQHAQMAAALTVLEAALPAWRSTASPEAAGAVLGALDGVNASLDAHLGDEEQHIVPVMESVITQKEVEWFAEHGRKATPKGQTWQMLGAILAAQPDGGKEFLDELPPPVRLLWRWFGRGRYAAHRAALTGQS